jgi:hypothetical protein
MLSFDDPRWSGLEGGYRVAFDPRPLLKKLETEEDVESAWHELWEELHHQGDVGEASYAAVPYLVRVASQRGSYDWNTCAIVGIIELARGHGNNPDLPSWLEEDYFLAIQELAKAAIARISRVDDPEEIRAILSIVAISKGARTYGRLLLNYSEDELLEFESAFNLKPSVRVGRKAR